MPAGRPLKFKDKATLDCLIDDYFTLTAKDEWTITGLALALDTSRETLREYKERPEFVDSIKRALDKVEHSYEIDLKKAGRTGTIFALKNFNWEDKMTQKIEDQRETVATEEIKNLAQSLNELARSNNRTSESGNGTLSNPLDKEA